MQGLIFHVLLMHKVILQKLSPAGVCANKPMTRVVQFLPLEAIMYNNIFLTTQFIIIIIIIVQDELNCTAVNADGTPRYVDEGGAEQCHTLVPETPETRAECRAGFDVDSILNYTTLPRPEVLNFTNDDFKKNEIINGMKVVALAELWGTTEGSEWTTKTMWTEGDPCGGWHGVECEYDVANNVSSIVSLQLAKNNLQGSIPSTIGSGMSKRRKEKN